jgi:hypothetical protein
MSAVHRVRSGVIRAVVDRVSPRKPPAAGLRFVRAFGRRSAAQSPREGAINACNEYGTTDAGRAYGSRDGRTAPGQRATPTPSTNGAALAVAVGDAQELLAAEPTSMFARRGNTPLVTRWPTPTT